MRTASVIAALMLMVPVPPTAWAADKAKTRPTPSAKESVLVPRTRDGHPDLEDTLWSMPYRAMMEPLPGMGSDLVVSEDKAKALYGRMLAMLQTNENFKIDAELTAGYTESLGLPLVRGERHTRLVASPANGRLPMTPEARREMAAANTDSMLRMDNPEDRPAGERCLDNGTLPPSTFLIGAPRQFVVTPQHVAIHVEYGDEIIIAPFAKEHGPWLLHPQYGDSIARWEGDTLIIETINLPAWNRVRVPLPANLIVTPGSKVTERYTRISAKELVYQFTVEDPTIYTAPWLGEYSFYAFAGRTYASSCHEGNYSLSNILGGARETERQAVRGP